MRIFNISKGVPGFWKLYDYGYQYTHMITTEAQESMRILIFWKTHGLKATQDAFKVSRSTLFAWQSAFHAGAKKITALNPGTQARHTQQRRNVDWRIVAEIRRLRLEVCPNIGKDKVGIFLTRNLWAPPLVQHRASPLEPETSITGRLHANY